VLDVTVQLYVACIHCVTLGSLRPQSGYMTLLLIITAAPLPHMGRAARCFTTARGHSMCVRLQ
jgi:hypothetical protein